MKIPLFLRVLPVSLFLFASIAAVLGYELEGPSWPKGSKVVMHLGLGTNGTPLADGSSSRNDSAVDAIAIWNGYLDFITMTSVSSATVPETSGDGVNSVFSASSLFGDTFGEDTLAATLYFTSTSDHKVLREADVVVNSEYAFDSYRGPLRSPGGRPLYDLHRVLLHEFGHVLGLDHVTDNPTGQAIMEPIISDLDHLGADDVAGVRHLYGADFIHPPAPQTIRIQSPFLNDLPANNKPTSYSAIGLPPGLTLGAHTGELSGTPTKSGVFDAVITAHGPIADAYTPYRLTVLGLEEVPGLLAILPFDAESMVADPIRPRIYISGFGGISVIDTKTFAVSGLPIDVPQGAHLSISADASTLLYPTEAYLAPSENRIDLGTLKPLPPLDIPANDSVILEGLNNQAYVADGNSIDQFDATTGALETSFGPPQLTEPPAITMSADRRTLFTSGRGPTGNLLEYDISTSAPTLLDQLSGSYFGLAPSPDSKFLYYLHLTATTTSLLRAHLPALNPSRLVSSNPSFGETGVGLDGTIFESVFPVNNSAHTPSGTYSVYNPVSLKQTASIPLGNLAIDHPYFPGQIVFDNTGKYLFANIDTDHYEIWVFSTDFASFPPPDHPTKNLLNVSTRALDQSGENAMIAGFIVQGSTSKQIVIRGIGPSLPITGALSDPVLELYDSSGKLITSNDNWISNRLNVLRTNVAPSSEREAAIVKTLPPGDYTAVVHDRENQPGLALVEVYDLDPKDSLLANLSTRGKVETGDNVMIGGFVIGGADPTKVLVRAIGPSLARAGIAQPLADPVLELRDRNGRLVAQNDNWRSTQQGEIIATGIQPSDNREAAIVKTLPPGSYTAVVSGQNGTSGVALVEVYNLSPSSH